VPARRILVISYPYPPMPSVGGNRWLAMSKYLRRLGHHVELLTTDAFGGLPEDESRGVHRARDLIAFEPLRRLLRRPPLPRGDQAPAVDTPPPAALMKVAVPDPYVLSWAPFALLGARRLLATGGFDCVVTTSAYESTHLVPLGLGRRRPAWIADFRDGWTLEPWRPPFPTALQRDLDRRLERRVVTTAERTAVVERPVGDDFRARLGVDAAHVPNGWDPDLDQEALRASPPELPEGMVTLVHTGKLSGGWGRSPAPLFEALARLRSDAPGTAARVRLVLAGRLEHAEQRMIANAGLGETVVHLGALPRAEALALQRQADVLVVLTSPNLVWELPGKVFEYFGARRPILALAARNEAARVIQETATGWTVPPHDVEAISELLRRIVEERLFASYAPRDLERYMYPAPAEAMSQEVERAVARRAPR
jgi:glycosyltransferase involved in cell wall biosynthesis